VKARTFQAIIMALIVAPCWGVSDSNDVGGLTAWTLAGDGSRTNSTPIPEDWDHHRGTEDTEKGIQS
jgi:hypothetical protein